MGLLNRLRGGRKSTLPARAEPASVQVRLLGGQDDLEVVGELAYQAALWQLCGGSVGDRVRCDIVAVLVPEPANPYDTNAVAVHISGQVVGYLPRATAQEYLPGLKQAMSVHGGYIALRGVIVGGGYYDDGPGRLGVWLEHDPADFGVHPSSLSRRLPPAHLGAGGVMRTGFTEAWLTDAEDDSYDLSWFNDLPEADRPAIAKLRELLATDPDPIDRHFQFVELETRLYRSRELYESALAEYDETCARHDAEMEGICQAFMAKWAKIPLLDTYRQMAIRQQKRRTGPPASGGPNEAWPCTGSARHAQRPSKISSNAATGPWQSLRSQHPRSRTRKLFRNQRSAPRRPARQEPPTSMPASKYSPATDAGATSSACECAAVNQPSAHHAAQQRMKATDESSGGLRMKHPLRTRLRRPDRIRAVS